MAANQLTVQMLSGPQLDDQLAGLLYLQAQPYVDKDRIVVSGCSYGGIQTLFAAEKNAGYRAAVAVSPAAQSWMGNLALQQRLTRAISGINIPTFIIHPPADDSLEPGKVLLQEAQRLGKPVQLEIFPPIGNAAADAHCFGGAARLWAPDALSFIAGVIGRP